jgi:hypothetical protein
VGDLIGSSFRLALRHWRALAVVGLATASLGGAAIQVATRIGFADVVITDDDVTGWSNDRIPVLAVLVLAGIVLSGLASLAAAWLTLRAHDDLDQAVAEGRHLPAVSTASELELARQALLGGLRSLPRAIGWYLIVTFAVFAVIFVVALFVVVASVVGVLLFLALIPLGLFLVVRWAFLVQAIVDRPGNPFGRSWAVSEGRFWPIVGRCVLLGLVTVAISSGVSIATSLLSGNPTGFAGVGGTEIELRDDGGFQRVELADLAPSVWAIVVGAVGAAATLVLATSVAMAGFAQLYRTRNPSL